MKRLSIPLALVLFGVIAGFTFAQSGTGAKPGTSFATGKFQGGTFTEVVPVPEGVTTATVTVLDWDPISNDVLMKEKTVPVTPGGQLLVKMDWICIDGVVWGIDGTSGENDAQAFVHIEWSNGDTFDGPEHILHCPD